MVIPVAKPQVSDRLKDLEDSAAALRAARDAHPAPNELAAVVRELRMVVREIDEIRRLAPKEGSLIDELAKQRAGRQSAAKGRKQAASGL